MPLLLRLAAGLGLLLATLAAPAAADDWLARDPATRLRVFSWNVSREHFFAAPTERDALLTALQPDLLLLDELSEATDAERVATAIRGALPGIDWRVVLGELGGNFERPAIVSRWPLQRVSAFDRLEFSASEARRWQVEAERAGWQTAELVRRWRLGVAAVGAIAEIDGRRLLLVAVDLQCCGDSPQAWEERRRRREAALIRAAIDAVLVSQRIDGVLLTGDLNTVQGAAPLRRLRGSAPALRLHAARIVRRGDGSDWTWDGRDTPYPSRRLDYQLHGGGLRVLASRLVDSEELSAAELQALGLAADSSRRLSPHRPLLADYGWRDDPAVRAALN